ncbi:MAG TPA: BLUF domain-containing protein [Roseomonas sp.]|nr:BLUF domain-containing protein [Roseomonas sp.]
MLVRCLYASRVATPLPASVLDEILVQSHRNNPRRGITGLLCFTDDVFVQVLEGGRDEVCELYNAIVRDERHSQVRLLTFEEISERRFGNWTMGQVDVKAVNPSLLLKYSKTAGLDPFTITGQATMALLTELVATGSITRRAAV